MKKEFFLKSYALFALAIIFFSISLLVNQSLTKPPIVISKQDAALNLNTELLKSFNLGFRRLISSSLWISTIIESDHDHYKKRDLNSWMFLRFNSISIMEPRFYENYAFGGPYLSIVKDDISGASILYNKGLSHYADDFALLRDAGFHFYFEANDFSRAYEIYSKLKNHPKASVSMISTLSRLEKTRGNPEAAFSMLLNKYNSLDDRESFFAQKIRENLYALKAEMDLACLNGAGDLSKCSRVDFLGDEYIKKNGSFQSIKPWEPFRIKIKKD